LLETVKTVAFETISDLFDNPLGLDDFEFLEFCAPDKGVLEPAFERMGLASSRATAARTSSCGATGRSISSPVTSR
jgi:4-hydroxyphenylpyruvate dioxygenase-like putative hemolysin